MNFYNKNYNPGEPIPVEANFQPDVDELSLSPNYMDAPEEDGEDQPG